MPDPVTLFHSTDVKPVVGQHPFFSGFLFFSEYAQKARGSVVFTTTVDEGEIIDIEDVLQYETEGNMRPFIADAQRLVRRQHGLEISKDLAEDLISQRKNYNERLVDGTVDRADYDSYDDYAEALEIERTSFEFDAETAWQLQMLGVEAAHVAGFRGVRLNDEMGRSVAVWMQGHDDELVLYAGEHA